MRTVLGPILLAYLLHKLLGVETKFSGEQSTGLFAQLGRELRERLTATLGIGRRGEDSAEIARSRASDRAVKLATGGKWRRRSHDRLGKAIDAAQHGLDATDAAEAEAEAAIVARIVRRNSVTALRRLDAQHVWSTTPVSPAVSIVEMIEPAAEEIAEPDTTPDIQTPAEPVISGWSGPRVSGRRVSGRRRSHRTPRTLRPARAQQVPQTAAQQPEAIPATLAPESRPTAMQAPKTRVDTKVVVPAMRAAYPSMTTDEIADKVGVTEHTVRRYLPAKDDRLEHANGSSV